MTTRTTTRPGILIRAALLVCGVSAASGCASATEKPNADLSEAERAAVEVAKRWLPGADAAVLKSVNAHSWPDSSLGCPQPGMSYMQVLTQGYIVQFEADGKVHEVHVAGENAVTCERQAIGAPRRPGSPTRVTTLPAMEEQAIADLAHRLHVSPASITIKQRLPHRFTDINLDCEAADAGAARAQGGVAGFQLRLDYAGRVYTYHTDLRRVMACPPIEAK